MSYDRINPDGSVTRMPGTYNLKKAKATIQSTYDINEKILKARKQKNAEAFADRAERIASFFKKLNSNKSARIEEYIPRD